MEKRILIVEDDRNIRANIADLLELKGYEVFEAADGLEGLQQAQTILPDLIICDIVMPKLNGYDLKVQLEQKTETKIIPFIFLTAKAEYSDIRKGMNLGADDYLTKPFSSAELLDAISTRMKKRYDLQSAMTVREEGGASIDENKTLPEDGRILVEAKGKSRFILIDQIMYISSNADYTYLHLVQKEKILIRRPLKKWELVLPSRMFVRVHRGVIVNLNHVDNIEKCFKGSYKIKMKHTEETIDVSYRYASKLKNKFAF